MPSPFSEQSRIPFSAFDGHSEPPVFPEEGTSGSPPIPPSRLSPIGSGGNHSPLPGFSTPGFQEFNTMSHRVPFNLNTMRHPAPQGLKPRLTATPWDDEGTFCFLVEGRGICVARREDNNMINGTKLLNVAGWTKGERDRALESETVSRVVLGGPMYLKGIWIPFERALDLANKEKVTELLFPLFVHNTRALLHHPENRAMQSGVAQKQTATARPFLPLVHSNPKSSITKSVGYVTQQSRKTERDPRQFAHLPHRLSPELTLPPEPSAANSVPSSNLEEQPKGMTSNRPKMTIPCNTCR